MKKWDILFILTIFVGIFLFFTGSIVFILTFSGSENEEVLILDNSDFRHTGNSEYAAEYDAHTIEDPARILIRSPYNESIPVRIWVENPSPFQQIDWRRNTPVNETFETVNSPSGNYRFIIKVEDSNHTFQDLEVKIFHQEIVYDGDISPIIACFGCQCGAALIPVGLIALFVSLAIDLKKKDDPNSIRAQYQRPSTQYQRPPVQYNRTQKKIVRVPEKYERAPVQKDGNLRQYDRTTGGYLDYYNRTGERNYGR